MVWGDWDSDGDLDLAAGNAGEHNRVYLNTGGMLTASAWWSSDESDVTRAVAWGDWESDGDLDLAAGNRLAPTRVYVNAGSGLETTVSWSSAETHDTYSLAWGDWDSDGDLDLAVGNVVYGVYDGKNRVYVNAGTALETTASWVSNEDDHTHSVAGGDWDADGDLDLAVGNIAQPNRVYVNTGSSLQTTAIWSSTESDETWAVAWETWMATATSTSPPATSMSRTGCTAIPAARSRRPPSGVRTRATQPAARPGEDMDGDGDLDLAFGTQELQTSCT